MLLLRTLDGVHRCAEVVGLDFTENETIYRLTYGDPMAPEMAAALARPPRSALRHWGEGSCWPWWCWRTAISRIKRH